MCQRLDYNSCWQRMHYFNWTLIFIYTVFIGRIRPHGCLTYPTNIIHWFTFLSLFSGQNLAYFGQYQALKYLLLSTFTDFPFSVTKNRAFKCNHPHRACFSEYSIWSFTCPWHDNLTVLTRVFWIFTLGVLDMTTCKTVHICLYLFFYIKA